MSHDTIPKGCSFLINKVGTESIFIPEKFNDDQKMYAQAVIDFMTNEVLPLEDEMDKNPREVTLKLLKRAGEEGLLMIDIPEDYEGMGLDKITSMLCGEKLSASGSFATSLGAHSGIGTLPILYFGNEEQKQRYLPKLATGEIIAAYALTEAGSGSDALAAKTKAKFVEEDGEQYYILNGTKAWITNGGFADLVIIFAKIDGEAFTAFIVETDTPGFTIEAEEHKLGLKGSSTCSLTLDNVKVPANNLLGIPGQGHKIAFNILNIGRYKLGVGSLGGSKVAFDGSLKYANERSQFGVPISSFGAIRRKLAEMASKIYSTESMVYRVAGYTDTIMSAIDRKAPNLLELTSKAIEEFAVEDSILKVYGSEILGFIADEAIQIHGGYGYSEEYFPARSYRDSRINRIFEGTNEINRMLIPGVLLKKTMSGQLPLFAAVGKANDALSKGQVSLPDADDTANFEIEITELAKNITLYLINAAIMKHMQNLKDQQQCLMDLSELVMEVFAMDSSTARLLELGDDAKDIVKNLTRITCIESYQNVLKYAKRIVPSLGEGAMLDQLMDAMEKFTVIPKVDLYKLKNEVAIYFSEMERWVL